MLGLWTLDSQEDINGNLQETKDIHNTGCLSVAQGISQQGINYPCQALARILTNACSIIRLPAFIKLLSHLQSLVKSKQTGSLQKLKAKGNGNKTFDMLH